ncbi:hypothetical protein AVEN_189618-1 [Araneus ventricosus]|uniref:Uncharacterized protein n=1 Tax=Araneus ventricosus TaxID=182803 RepID=A0A4Y2PIY9_ARAVE|nr:hypothetical protein AVEN_189618-1 [Araneus ventricosus]
MNLEFFVIDESIEDKLFSGNLSDVKEEGNYRYDLNSKVAKCPDLDPSDFQLFLRLKELLCGKRFGCDEELEKAWTTWINELEAEEYDLGILKLANRYDKCLNVGGDYVEK